MSAKEDNTKHDNLKDLVDAFELDLITDALKITFGNQIRAAELLGTTRRVINYKIHKHAINLASFRLKRPRRRTMMKREIH